MKSIEQMRKKDNAIRYSASSSLILYIDDDNEADGGTGSTSNESGTKQSTAKTQLPAQGNYNATQSSVKITVSQTKGQTPCFTHDVPPVCGLMLPTAAAEAEAEGTQHDKIYTLKRTSQKRRSSNLRTSICLTPGAFPPSPQQRYQPQSPLGAQPISPRDTDAIKKGNRVKNNKLFRRRSVESIYFPPGQEGKDEDKTKPVETAEQTELVGTANLDAQEKQEKEKRKRERRLTVHLSTFVHMDTKKGLSELGLGNGVDAAGKNRMGEEKDGSQGKTQGAVWHGNETIRVSPALNTAVDMSRASILMDPEEFYSIRNAFDPSNSTASAAASALSIDDLKPLYKPPVPVAAAGGAQKEGGIKPHRRNSRRQQQQQQQQDFVSPLSMPPAPPPQGFPENETPVLLEFVFAGGECSKAVIPRQSFRTMTHFRGWLLKQATSNGQMPASLEILVYNYTLKAFEPMHSPACITPYAVFRFCHPGEQKKRRFARGSERRKGSVGQGSDIGSPRSGVPREILEEKYASVSSRSFRFHFDDSGSGVSSPRTRKLMSSAGANPWTSVCGRASSDEITFTNRTKDCVIRVTLEEEGSTPGITPSGAGEEREGEGSEESKRGLYDLSFSPQTFFLRPSEVIDMRAALATRCTLTLGIEVAARFCIVSMDASSTVLNRTITLRTSVQTPHIARLSMNELFFEKAEDNAIEGKDDGNDDGKPYSRRARWRGNDVVVKVIPKPSEKVGALLQSGAQTLFDATTSPHFARFYGAVYAPGCDACLVTEYCACGTLLDAVTAAGAAGKPFPLLLKIKCLLDCAAGMRYLHSRSVVHKRLKPANVLFYTRNPMATINCKVTDVGSLWDMRDTIRSPSHLRNSSYSSSSDSSSSSSSSASSSSPRATSLYYPRARPTVRVGNGVPPQSSSSSSSSASIYTAPEILLEKPYGTPADVYSFAYVIWFVWFGYEAFTRGNFRTERDIVDYVTSGRRLPITLDAPPAIADLIVRCWDRNQSQRPTFAQIEETLRSAYNTIIIKFGVVKKD